MDDDNKRAKSEKQRSGIDFLKKARKSLTDLRKDDEVPHSTKKWNDIIKKM
jgi:hypothetical protein